MSKLNRRIRIAGVSCLAAGILLFVAGVLLGANFGLYIDDKGIRYPSESGLSFDSGDIPRFTGINVSSNITDIEITAGDAFYADFFTQYNDVNLDYHVSNGILYIEVEKPHTFLIPIGFAPIESRLRIVIPNDIRLDTVTVVNVNNDTRIAGIAATDFYVESISGDVTMEGIHGELASVILDIGNGRFGGMDVRFMEFGAAQGSGTFTDSRFEYLTATSLHGDIRFTDCRVDELYVTNRNGNITAFNLTADGWAEFHNTHGNVDIHGVFLGWTDVNVNGSGDVTMRVLGNEELYTYSLATRGVVFLNGDEMAPPFFRVNTLTAIHNIKVWTREGTVNMTFLK
jgi:hypothetical protein